MEKIRLSRLMAMRGLCSRREADRLIEAGQVRVDGVLVTKLGTQVATGVTIELARPAQRRQRRLITILLNKPVGYVSGQPERGHPPATSLISEPNRFRGDRSAIRYHRSHLRSLAPAGRLDIDSQGLLVLTQDGRIARQLVAPDSAIEKEYLVRVQGTVDDSKINRLRSGLELDGRPLKPAQVESINPDQLRFVLTEGRKRQIRRMCEQLGLQVTGLKRVRIGSVRLAGLPQGQWRYLARDERF